MNKHYLKFMTTALQLRSSNIIKVKAIKQDLKDKTVSYDSI